MIFLSNYSVIIFLFVDLGEDVFSILILFMNLNSACLVNSIVDEKTYIIPTIAIVYIIKLSLLKLFSYPKKPYINFLTYTWSWIRYTPNVKPDSLLIKLLFIFNSLKNKNNIIEYSMR